jgi:ureidoacrylate peracid hydrolase
MAERTRVTLDGGTIVVEPASGGDRPPGMGGPLRIEPGHTAVITVDVQRYFLETPPFAAMSVLMPPLAVFLDEARAAGLSVVHVKTEFRTGMADAGRQGSRTRQMMDGLGIGLVLGSPAAELAAGLRQPSDVVVTKTRFSGFAATDLAEVLRKRRIETLIFAGGTTTVCVESTVREAVFLEYNALVLSDCTGDLSSDLHESALRRIDIFFGWVCNSSDLLPALRGLTSRAATT